MIFHEFLRQTAKAALPAAGKYAALTPASRFVGEVDRLWGERLAAESEPHCFFCPGHIGKVARFPAELIPKGTINVGDTVLFPSLFALGKYHSVAADDKQRGKGLPFSRSWKICRHP